MDESLLKSEEKAVLALRALYRKYGYLPFRMSKFEEYELYMRNKDFLVSDRIIAFNDTNGRLLALKPDVTLSIIKSGRIGRASSRKCTIMKMSIGCLKARDNIRRFCRRGWNVSGI